MDEAPRPAPMNAPPPTGTPPASPAGTPTGAGGGPPHPEPHASVSEWATYMVQRTHPAAWLWLSVAVVLLDQATKFIASRFLDVYERVEVLPVLDFTLLHNTGAAFSLLADAAGWQRGFFVTLGIVVSVALTVWMWRQPRGERLLPIALSLIVGGA